ncbi:hypothetical protein L6452_22694 [Arctium lappa]|uniref:Uncharacterized protein n=1 Tax=Arctium lappa TaxID=4217 RepID=A0ACB9B0V6_ARCLA|nr:hypothetical protein L6452_22694 [Arctium lappa]
METKLVAEKADQMVYEGEGGAYYAWTPSKSPLLSESKLGAGKLLLHPLGFAFPHFFDSSKIAYVLQAQVVGEMGYFFLAGAQGMLRGFQSDIVAKLFDLNNKVGEDLIKSQPGSLIVKLRNGIEFPKPTEDFKEKVYAAIDTPRADVVVKGGGIINSLTEKEFPVLVGMGLSARFVRLKGKAMLAPSYVADGTGRVIYVAKGSGRIRVVGKRGKPSFDDGVEEGELIVLPQFLATAVIADEGGMELFFVVNSSKPTFEQLVGNVSVWKALSSVVLQSVLNISPELEQLFKEKNTKSLMIIPPRN